MAANRKGIRTVLDLEGLILVLEIGLLVFCLIDCIQTPSHEVRGLDKALWVILIILLPLIGGIAWLVAGRPPRQPQVGTWRMGSGFPEHQRPRAGRPPRGPDDDETFLREMRQVNSEQEETLNRWEADLRRREAEQRRRDTEDQP
jgi:hypothetical protein